MIKNRNASFSVLRIILTSIVLIFCLSLGVMAFNLQVKDVKIILDNGYEINVTTMKNTVLEVLEENQIDILTNEIVTPNVDTVIERQAIIKISKTTDEIKEEKQDDDIISSLNSKIQEEISANYKNIVEKIVTEIEEIPFETIIKDVSAEAVVDVGDKILVQGVNGQKEVTYKIKYILDKEISREKISETILQEKVDQVIQKASKVSSRSGTARTAVTGDKAVYQAYAQSKMTDYAWSDYDFDCLVSLWDKESGWRVTAGNTSSGAYGIPQALPASKMASYGSDYLTSYETQINWGLNYIQRQYGSPANAWSHFQRTNWY